MSISNKLKLPSGKLINLPCLVEQASDGFHSFEELYEHRNTLLIALCKNMICYLGATSQEHAKTFPTIWRSRRHADGELCFEKGEWFVMGIGKEKGEQITYHLPISKWEETNFAETLDNAPPYDNHTPNDVLDRIKKL